jgi:hypothetical protein
MLVFIPSLWAETRHLPPKPVTLPLLPQTKRVQ